MTDFDELGEFEPPSQSRLDEEALTPYQRDLRETPLLRASDLLTAEEEEPISPGGLYRGFRILPRGQFPSEATHQHFEDRFYVSSPSGIVGLVPWAGSKIIWPWETGWRSDLHRTEVQSLLKEERKEKKR